MGATPSLPQPTREEIIRQRAVDATSLGEALVVTLPEMVDAFNEIDEATLALTAWAARAMQWADVAVPKNETSYALVQKRVAEERGKRMCFRATIVQIQARRSETREIATGIMLGLSDRDVFHFHAVASSGSLVAKSDARFCGVVTGRYDYPNSGGGTSHAIKVVGMFDLPENRRPTVVPKSQ